MEPELHIGGITGVHLEQPSGVFLKFSARQFGAGDPGLRQGGDIAHTVHAIGCDAVAVRKGQQVTVFVVLTQAVGTGDVFLITVLPLAVQAPVEVPEGDLPVFGNGFLNGVYIIIDGLVHALDASGHHHITAHQTGIVDGTLTAQLLDQFPGLLLRQEPAGLNGIDEQFQLRKLEIPGRDVIAALFAGNGDDVHAIVLQSGDVGINGLAFADDIMLVLQHLNEFSRRDRMVHMGIAL